MTAPSSSPDPSAPSGSSSQGGLTRPLLFLMCLATGLCAGGNYFNQPLLDDISEALHVSPGTAAISVTVAQSAYALGLVLVTPLGDLLERRRLTVVLMVVTAAGQLVCGFSPTFGALLLGIAVAGLFSVAAQVLVPFASTLAEPGREGRAVGVVMSGLLAGVLAARAVSGVLADWGGWQLVFRLAGVLMLVVAFLLHRALPRSVPENPPGYAGLFVSMGRLVRTHPRLTTRSLLSAVAFASMSAIFATTTLLLAGPGFGLSPTAIGLVSLAGLAGTLTASLAGRLHDAGRVQQGSLLGLAALAAGWGAFVLGGRSVAWFCVGMVLVDAGIQLVHVLSMNAVYDLDPGARGRLNSVYMTVYFLGAAAGSAVGVWAWGSGHWAGVCAAGFVLTGLSALAWAADVVLEKRES